MLEPIIDLVKQAILLVDCRPDRTTFVRRVGLLIVQQVDQDVVFFSDLAIVAVLVLNTPFLVILRTVYFFLLLLYFVPAKHALRERSRELVGVQCMHCIIRVLLNLVLLPKLWHLLLIALAHGALVIVAEALLCPEGALSFQIDLVRSEKGCHLQLLQDGCDPLVQVLELLDRRASSIQVARYNLCSALRYHKRVGELGLEEIRPIEAEENRREQ